MIEIKKLSAGYGSKSVLQNVNAEFEAGRLTSIVGVNGCGKSTLLKAMLGILPISAGEILIDCVSLTKMSRNEIAKKVSYLSQGMSVPDMTVGQLVLHGRFPYLSYPRHYKAADREIARAAMEAVGISALADMPLSALSGGMRQNAYIAMALAQDTDHILLDEPTTYLDIRHQLELMKLLGRLADSGKSIVTVMHDLPLAFNFSDEIAVLDKGQIIMQAPPAELCESALLYDIFGIRLGRIEGKDKYYYEI